MKKYYEYLEEITSDELYEGFLGYGMFEKNLPSIFSSELFFNYCSNIAAPSDSRGSYQYVSYESLRNNGLMRQYAIPVPMAYEKLCRCLADNWDNIKQHFKNTTTNQTHKISRIHIRKKRDTKQLLDINYPKESSNFDFLENMLLGKRYVLRTDINAYFPSVYTHSIPWALCGKEHAKFNRDKSLWFNQIDKCAQNMTDGETHGILVGPHASHLLSEIILTVVDKQLSEMDFEFVRRVDDYTCYIETYEKAVHFLVTLRKKLGEFGLLINDKKTEITALPETEEDVWLTSMRNGINTIGRDKYGFVSKLGIIEYLDLAKRLYEQCENAAVYNYALKALSKQEFGIDSPSKKYFVEQFLHLSVLYPYLLPLLDVYMFDAHCIESETIRRYTNFIIKEGYRLQNEMMFVHGLYYAIKWNFEILDFNVDNVISLDSCLALTLAFKYSQLTNNKVALQKLRAYAKMIKASDFDKHWIFLYEIRPKSDLSGDWQSMKENGVTFLKEM